MFVKIPRLRGRLFVVGCCVQGIGNNECALRRAVLNVRTPCNFYKEQFPEAC